MIAAEVASPRRQYQWRKNGTAIGGASLALVIAAARAADAGSYSVVATNAAGSVTWRRLLCCPTTQTSATWSTFRFGPV